MMTILALTLLIVSGGDSIEKEAVQPDEKDPYSRESYQADSPLIQEDLGIALLPGKILAQSQMNVYQSVFLQIENPSTPPRSCNLDCSPDISQVAPMLESEGCWIDRMTIVKTGILSETSNITKVDCFIQCLANSICGALAYDKLISKCYILTGNYYRVNALVDGSTSSTAKLECILSNFGTTRADLCRNSNSLYSSVLEAMMYQHQVLVNSYLQKYLDVRAAYDLYLPKNQDPPNRKRRAWSDFDFLEKIPVIGHFYEILKSPSENRKMKQHLSALSEQFSQFATAVDQELRSSRTYHKKVLRIIEAGFGRVYSDIAGLKCDVASLAALTIFQQTLKLHEAKLDSTFFSTRHGKLTSSLTQTITLEDLRLIMTENPNFHGTVYEQNPEILYRVGDLYLMDVQDHSDSLLFHFLLTAPKISNNSLYQTYYPVQVPITTSESPLCFMPELPQTLLIKDGKIFSADTTDCERKEDLILCQQDFEDSFSPNIAHVPCLNNEPSKCALKQTSCETKMIFTRAGALVFSREDILGMRLSDVSRLTVLHLPEKTSYFFPWHRYKMIQSGTKIIYSLDNQLTVKNLTWTSEEVFLELKNYVKATSIKQMETNISQLKQDLDNVTHLASLDLQPNFLGLGMSRKKWTDFIGIFSLSSTILSCAAVFLLCCFKRLKKNNRLIQIVMETLHKEKQQQRNHRYSKKLHLTETTLDDDEDSLPPEIQPQLRSRQVATPRAPICKKPSRNNQELVTTGCQTLTTLLLTEHEIEPDNDIPEHNLGKTKKVIAY
ncbi:hypothetical protein ACHWQZ_G013640 [Mnemiopsis leidyi]